MHALMLADLEGDNPLSGEEAAFQYEVIDPEGMDSQSLTALKNSTRKVDLVYQWVQNLVVQGERSGILAVPAPILARAFAELNAGIVQYHAALKIAKVPFPFPYNAARRLCLSSIGV